LEDWQSFKSAVELAAKTLKNAIEKACDHIDGDEFVRNAIKNASDERLIILDKYVSWQDVVITEAPKALFVVLPAWPSPNDDWVIKTIDVEIGSFENRKKLPASWAGKINEELATVTGVSDAKFCHPARFMAITKSKAGVLKLAYLALND
jgi:uncharacterized UPF0160 family protein